MTAETRHCAAHGDYHVRIISMPRHGGDPLVIRQGHCSKCAGEEAAAKAAKDAATEAEAKQQRIEKRFAQSGIPTGFVNRTFDNYETTLPGQRTALAKARTFADEFPAHAKRGTNFMFIGRIGTGKTHLAVAIGSAVMARGHSCMYETAFDLVSRMRDCMRRDAPVSTSDMLDTYSAVDLLILDEVGIQAATDDVKAHLTNVLDRRYRSSKPTILLTNLDKTALAEYVGDRVADRLRERASVVPFDWESQRGAVRAQQGDF